MQSEPPGKEDGPCQTHSKQNHRGRAASDSVAKGTCSRRHTRQVKAWNAVIVVSAVGKLIQVHCRKDDDDEARDSGGCEKGEKGRQISSPDVVFQPGAVVVGLLAAAKTPIAVKTLSAGVYLAVRTPLQLHRKMIYLDLPGRSLHFHVNLVL